MLTGAAADAAVAAADAAVAAGGAAEAAASSRARLVLHLAVHARKLWHLLLDATLGPGVQWHTAARPAAAASAASAAASASAAAAAAAPASAAAAAAAAPAAQAKVKITLPAGTVAGQTIRVQVSQP